MAKLLAANQLKRSAIVTARKQAKAIPDGWLLDTLEEHKHRGHAIDAMFREMKRKIAAELPGGALSPARLKDQP